MFDPRGPVLGIDPGVSRCGYGAVRRVGGRLETVVFGVLRTDPARPLPERLAGLADELGGLVAGLAPCALAVERVLFQTNARTAISVGQASGLALAAAARAGVPVVEYSPNEVKLAIAGDGRAGKAEVQAMVVRLLALDELPAPDAADALALACCHVTRDRLARTVLAAGAPRAGDAASPRLTARIEAALARGGEVSS